MNLILLDIFLVQPGSHFYRIINDIQHKSLKIFHTMPYIVQPNLEGFGHQKIY